MKFFYKEAILFLGLFAISAGGTYYYCYSSGSSNNVSNDLPEEPLTPGQVLCSSLTSLKKFNLDATVEFVYQKDMTHGELSVKGAADVSDLSAPKVQGDLRAYYGGSSLNGTLSFMDDTVYVDYNTTHLKLETTEIMNFVEILPSMGLNIAIPDELANLDLNTLMADLQSATPVNDNGGYLFEINLAKDISLFFKTDADYHFTGVKSSRFFYKDMRIYLDANIDESSADNVALVNPETVEGAPKYISFRPALNLFEGIHNVFSKDANTLGLNLDVKHRDPQTLVISDFVNVGGDVSYDLSKGTTVGLDLNIKETGRVHQLGLYLMDGTLFLNQANINKVSLEGQNIFALVDYILGQIKDEQIKALMDKMTQMMEGVDINAILSNLESLNAWIKSIETLDNKVVVKLDLSVFNIGINEINLELGLNKKELLGIKLEGLDVNNYLINLDLTVKTNNFVPPVKEEYMALDPALDLVPVIFDLINETKFRFKLNGSVLTPNSLDPIKIGADIQMDTLAQVGYGEASIIDLDKYDHNIKLDYDNTNELLFSYRNKLNGRVKKNSIDELILLFQDIINNPSPHLYELFGDLLNSMNNTPLGQALKGDIGILFATETFTNINVTPEIIEMDVSGAIINLDTKFHLAINYNYEKLHGIKISNLVMNNNAIEIEILLDTFDDARNNTRLVADGSYLDFSSIKMLLEFGLNTSRFNDFHLQGTANVTCTVIGIPISLDIPLDAKIKNDGGSVSVQVDISSIPIIPAVTTTEGYKNTYSRRTSVYYQNQTVYINRVDEVKKNLIFGDKVNYHVTGVIDETNFMNNILEYLLSDTLGLRSNIVSAITDGATKKDPNAKKEQIIYENIVRDYAYNLDQKYFYLDLDIAEIAKNPDLTGLTVKIGADEMAKLLNSVEVFLNVSVGVKISVSAKLNLVEPGKFVTLDGLDSFVLAHQNDPRNTILKVQTPLGQ